MAIGTPVFGTVQSQNTAATTIAVPYPAGVNLGDALVCIVDSNHTAAPTLPSGWTDAGQAGYNGTASQTPAGRMFGIIATATEVAASSSAGSLTVAFGATVTGNGIMFVATGVDSTIWATTGTKVTPAASTTYNIPSLTTPVTGCLLVVNATAAGPAGSTWNTVTAPATMTEAADQGNTIGPSTAVDWLIWSGSGATGIVPVVRTTSLRGCGAMGALLPASTATASPRNVHVSNTALPRSFNY